MTKIGGWTGWERRLKMLSIVCCVHVLCRCLCPAETRERSGKRATRETLEGWGSKDAYFDGSFGCEGREGGTINAGLR
ncbi:hypothetical protein EDD21DRAFT_380964 [Dissophora ornata]|nr:hypothetical protein EDD21DRAFT_380964 [Dissophora ornata]